MIISRTKSGLPFTIAAPTIGSSEAEKLLACHRRLFDAFGASIKSPGPAETGPVRLSLCIETERVRMTSTRDPSRLSADEAYRFTIDLASHLTRADILAGIEQGALCYVASIHSRVLAMNNLSRGDLHPLISVVVLMTAIEQDSNGFCRIVMDAAERNRSQV